MDHCGSTRIENVPLYKLSEIFGSLNSRNGFTKTPGKVLGIG